MARRTSTPWSARWRRSASIRRAPKPDRCPAHSSMHIEVRGSGPDLVLLHGWAMHGGVFATLAERLEPHFRLHLVDLPGHGRSNYSPVPLELDAVADNLARRLPRATWLGWSLGGLFALQLALRHPERARGLAMLCAPPRFM